MKPYFLDQDDDGHWYLVEAAHRAEWDKWLELDGDSLSIFDKWEVPAFAKALGGGPQHIIFSLDETLVSKM